MTDDTSSAHARWIRHGRHVVPPGITPLRLDRYLAERFTYRSRAQWSSIIRMHRIRVNGRPARPGHRVQPGWRIEYLPDQRRDPEPAVATSIGILYEDDHLLAVDKPADLPLHPSGRYFENTLLAILLKARGETLDRPGLRVVHRLDRETSGVVAFGKSRRDTRCLAGQFEDRTARKVYLALVHGAPARGRFEVDAPLGPRLDSRIRKAVGVVSGGRPACTSFRVLARGPEHALLAARPRTGRLHQIRVHAQHAGHPIVGDKMYGLDETFFLKLAAGEPLSESDQARLLAPRQALHAWKLGLAHPHDGRTLELCAPLPGEIVELAGRLGLDWDEALAQRTIPLDDDG
jgi:23S rRNA pseudouridine1911/1915/1917 synthase